jgi:nucleoid-associated protein YgaU
LEITPEITSELPAANSAATGAPVLPPAPLAPAAAAPQFAPEEVASMIFGERLDQIAFRYYGDARYWRVLALFNAIDDPIHVVPGRLLRVPPAAAIKIK